MSERHDDNGRMIALLQDISDKLAAQIDQANVIMKQSDIGLALSRKSVEHSERAMEYVERRDRERNIGIDYSSPGGEIAQPKTRGEEIAEKLFDKAFSNMSTVMVGEKHGGRNYVYAKDASEADRFVAVAREHVAAAIDAARAEVKEEAAKIAERHTAAYAVPAVNYGTVAMAYCAGHKDGATHAAQLIRALP